MPRKKAAPRTFSVELLQADVPTKAGVVYPRDILVALAESIKAGRTPVTIEEVSPVERRAKKIAVCDSWKEHAMADAVGACMRDDGMLVVDFAIRSNKYGRLLEATLDSGKKFEFFPIGIGNTNDKGVVTAYALQYVTFNEIV